MMELARRTIFAVVIALCAVSGHLAAQALHSGQGTLTPPESPPPAQNLATLSEVGEDPEPIALIQASDGFIDPLSAGLPPVSGYVPVEQPYNNPGTDLALTPAIPTSPDCTVRPQTVMEVQRMRQSASRIAEAIQVEVGLMSKRKAYVEQMTAYLNDRIRELNKVKSELMQEIRWIEVSNERIKELSEKEKLVKMEDILACLNQDSERLLGEKNMKNSAISDLRRKAQDLENSIGQIQGRIHDVRSVEMASPGATRPLKLSGSAISGKTRLDPASSSMQGGEAQMNEQQP